MKKNILLVDWNPKPNWPFMKGLEEATGEQWELHSCDSSRNNRGGIIQKIIHYAKLFYVPLRVILHQRRYKQVLAFHKFHAFILALYFQLFHMKNVPKITVMTFIYKPKSGALGKIYHKLVSTCVKSKYIQNLVVYSKSEISYYAKLFGVSETKFFSTNYCIEDCTTKIPIGNKGDYFLSVGRSNRDFAFLLSAWSKDQKLIILNDQISNTTQNPNIEIKNDCFGDDYLRLLSDCYAVIIPLEDPHISSGQLVIIQAMMYGKPIIITQNDTLSDYIVNEHDGVIIEKTKEALETAIDQLENNEYYDRMSAAERKTFYEKYSLHRFGVQIGEILKHS